MKREKKKTTEECSRYRHSRNNGPKWSLDVTLSYFTELKEKDFRKLTVIVAYPISILPLFFNNKGILAWRISEAGEPGGLPSMGSHRVGHD